MRTLILIILQVILFAFLAFWFQDNPGQIRIVWLGYRIEVSVALFIVGIALSAGTLYFLVRLFFNIIHVPGFLKARYAKFNQMRGIHAVEDSMIAFLAQDGVLLKKTGKFVGSFLKKSPLNHFFRAEAAMMNQETAKAKSLFKDLSKSKAMSFAGHFGLMRLALAEGNNEEALAAAQKALDQNPRADVVRQKIIDLYIEKGEADKALKELEIAQTLKPGKGYSKKKSSTLLSQAESLGTAGQWDKALKKTAQALKEAPESFQAISFHVQCAKQLGKENASKKVIEKGWATFPQGSLVPLYLEICQSKTEMDAFKAVQKLTKSTAENPESLKALATYAFNAKLWGVAKESVEKLEVLSNKDQEILHLKEKLSKIKHKSK